MNKRIFTCCWENLKGQGYPSCLAGKLPIGKITNSFIQTSIEPKSAIIIHSIEARLCKQLLKLALYTTSPIQIIGLEETEQLSTTDLHLVAALKTIPIVIDSALLTFRYVQIRSLNNRSAIDIDPIELCNLLKGRFARVSKYPTIKPI
jgi:hypothetical protein